MKRICIVVFVFVCMSFSYLSTVYTLHTMHITHVSHQTHSVSPSISITFEQVHSSKINLTEFFFSHLFIYLFMNRPTVAKMCICILLLRIVYCILYVQCILHLCIMISHWHWYTGKKVQQNNSLS